MNDNDKKNATHLLKILLPLPRKVKRIALKAPFFPEKINKYFLKVFLKSRFH
jgi:hypothetical protein